MFVLPDFSREQIDGMALVRLIDQYGQAAFEGICAAFEALQEERARPFRDQITDPVLRQAVRDLREKGVGCYPGLFADPDLLESLRALSRRTAEDAVRHTAEAKVRSIRSPASGIKYQAEHSLDPALAELGLPRHGRVRSYFPERVAVQDPTLRRIYQSEVIAAVYRAEYGVTDMHYDLLLERISPAWEGDFWWHFDTPWQYVKVAVLLEDVDMRNAPMRYKIGSHKLTDWKRNHALYEYFLHGYDFAWPSASLAESLEGEVVYGTGKAGDVFFFETNGIHSGTRCLEGERVALTLYPIMDSIKAHGLIQLHDLYHKVMKQQNRRPGTPTPPPATQAPTSAQANAGGEYAPVAEAQAVAHHDRTPVALTQMNGVKLVFTAPNATTVKRARRLFEAEPETIIWLDRTVEPGEVLCDIGANVGTYSLYAAVARRAQVFAFEPASQNFALLNTNIVANGASERVLATCLGLSDSASLTRMFLSGTAPGNAMHAVGDNRDFRLQKMGYAHVQGCVTTTLDQLVESGAMPCPHHIKIDVDGFEHKVIAGAHRTLADLTLRSLLVELNTNLPEHRDVMARLVSLGFHYTPRQVEMTLVKDGVGKGLGNVFFFRSAAAAESFADALAAGLAAPSPAVSVSLFAKV